MSDLKRYFSGLILSSAIVGAGAAMAETKDEPQASPPPRSASEHCYSLDTEARFQGCMLTARIVDALKSGNGEAISAALSESDKAASTPSASIAPPKP